MCACVYVYLQWAFPFNTPVDTSRFVDYLKVVATPMDFSTVRNRTEAGYYRDPKVRSAVRAPGAALQQPAKWGGGGWAV